VFAARLRKRDCGLWHLDIFRSTAGHGFQSSTIVLTNLGNRTGHIQAIICLIRSTNPHIFIEHKSNSCHKIIYYVKIWTYCMTAGHIVTWKPWPVAVSQTTLSLSEPCVRPAISIQVLRITWRLLIDIW